MLELRAEVISRIFDFVDQGIRFNVRTDQQGQHAHVKLPSESVQVDLICRGLHAYAVDAREKQAPNHIGCR